MKNENDAPPAWNPEDKAASLLANAEWLHGEAVRLFLEDGTHGQILFLFTDAGLGSVNPVPAGTDPALLVAGVRRAVREHGLSVCDHLVFQSNIFAFSDLFDNLLICTVP